MDIAFRTRRLQKTFNAADALQRSYGARMARTIMSRMAVLRAARDLGLVPTTPAARDLGLVPTTPPERRHQLVGDRDEQFAVDLVHPYRLVFEANHEPIPRKDDGGIDTDQVTAITVLDVVDYH